jgi:hypothetical protein
MSDPVKLGPADWKELLGGKPHTIGKTEFVIKPLCLSDLADVITILEPLKDDFQTEGITPFNIREKIIPLAALLVRKVPVALAMMSGIQTEDVSRLPLGTVIPLLADCLEVNLGSIDQLRKNWDTLIRRLEPLWAPGQGSSSQKSQTSSSRRATRGKTSKATQ